MSGGTVLLDKIEMTLRSHNNDLLTVYIDVYDNSLSRKWLRALNQLLVNHCHLEKNYCWLGWIESARNAEFLCDRINASIAAINAGNIDYKIYCEPYTVHNTIDNSTGIVQQRMNMLHRYFEDLQGWSGSISSLYQQADTTTRWHIRQLNLLCHEYESFVLTMRKMTHAPEWRRPSQLMCWLNAPRFQLEPEDYELFGIDTINRSMGGVFVGVNKAVGKHHWEVFNDEGRDSRVNELVTTGLRTQTEAAGDFDIEWARDPSGFDWQQQKLNDFRAWLIHNGFDPNDKSLTIGHPQIGQIDLLGSFGTQQPELIWGKVAQHLDVYKIQTSNAQATYNYRWSDPDYQTQQIKVLS